MQVTGKVVRHGGKIAGRRGRTRDPVSRDVLDAARRCDVGHPELPDLRKISRGDLAVGIVGIAHGHRHVRLARTQPDFAHQHVLDHDGVGAHGHEFGRDGRPLLRSERHPPASVGSRDRRRRLPAKLDLYFFGGRGPAPHHQRLVPLQHGAIAKQRSQGDIGPRTRRTHGQRGTEDKRVSKFHSEGAETTKTWGRVPAIVVTWRRNARWRTPATTHWARPPPSTSRPPDPPAHPAGSVGGNSARDGRS